MDGGLGGFGRGNHTRTPGFAAGLLIQSDHLREHPQSLHLRLAPEAFAFFRIDVVARRAVSLADPARDAPR
jgi:hypothetical protein